MTVQQLLYENEVVPTRNDCVTRNADISRGNMHLVIFKNEIDYSVNLAMNLRK